MKTRIDFVSNSSSCSFVIALDKNAKLDEFIEEACKGCLKHVSDDDSKIFVEQQNEFNKAVLDYHLRASELLYLGCLCIGKVRDIYMKEDDEELFKNMKAVISDNTCGERLIENTDDKIVIERIEEIDRIAISKCKMEYVTNAWHWDDDYSYDLEMQKKAAKNIVEFAKNYSDSRSDYKSRQNSKTYVISRNTVWNTQALIAAGYKVVLDDWMDLGKFDKMLQDGQKLVVVHVNNGGDGVDEDALYSFGGWDGEDVFDSMPKIEIIDSETW